MYKILTENGNEYFFDTEKQALNYIDENFNVLHESIKLYEKHENNNYFLILYF